MTMSEFEKLSVLVPGDLARRIRDAVDGERYIVESDVILEALQDWEVKQQIRATKVARLRELIQEGEDSGFEPMSDDEFERIKEEGRALLASRNAAECVRGRWRSAERRRRAPISWRFGCIWPSEVRQGRIEY